MGMTITEKILAAGGLMKYVAGKKGLKIS